MRDPRECKTMAELREVIDGIDRDLVALLAQRQACIDRAAEIKAESGLPARIPDRVDAVLDRVAEAAAAAGLAPDLADALWTTMIEWSIAREEKKLHEGK